MSTSIRLIQEGPLLPRRRQRRSSWDGLLFSHYYDSILDRMHKVKQYKRYTFSSTPPTTAGGSVTGAIYSPIRRLPTEILADIFSLHSDTFAPAFRPADPPYEFEAELDRLANIQLLTLSRVCGQWHNIVMDTPALWSTFNLNGVLWTAPYHLNKVMTLLAAGLERGRNVPIELRIFAGSPLPLPARVFELLAQHSHRWRTVEFICSTGSIDLSILKGRLPVLQRLEIDLGNMSRTIDFLEGASRLETLIVPGYLLEKIGTIPFKQLTEFRCECVKPMGISRAISFASELSPGSHFHLLADVGEPDDPVCIHPRTLAISRFSCRITSHFYDRLCSRRLGGIFASLSLPNLEELRLISTEDPKIVYDWPHAQFLELSERSGFHRSLKVLRIPEVLITDGDLIAVLSSLESLEHLEVADKQRVDGEGVDLVVVTDIFLQAITFQAPDANRHLIPRLRHFTCATQLQFTDHVFLAFVASRLEVCSSCTFRVDIRFLDGLEGASHCASLSTLLHDLRVHGDSRLEYDLGGGHLPLA